MENNKEEITFENAFKKLGEIVQFIEKGDQTLEESLKKFEEGVNLTRVCQASLASAELKVEQLLKISTDGQVETKKF